MKEVVIISAVRTAIGSFGGALSKTPVEELGAIVIKEALKRAKIEPDEVSEVLMGCTLQAGRGQNVARQSAIKAGIPKETPALTLNNLCGSGLKSINMAAALIMAGEADVVVAGGMENMSAAPFVLQSARFGYRLGNNELVDTMINDGLTDAFNLYHMGITAENIAKLYSISREEQDAYAASSQQKCEAAQNSGRFKDEIVPVPITIKNKESTFQKDEFPRPGVSSESLSRLKSAFINEGTVTVGNASGINDGAAAIVIMSAEKALELGVKPIARFKAGASTGVDPALMGIGPVTSTKKVLEKLNLAIEDIDLIEANEAFAAQLLAVEKELAWDRSKVNVNGGAIALGHPIGASGCRILVSLLYELEKRDLKTGLATLCVGGGMGVSTIVEKI